MTVKSGVMEKAYLLLRNNQKSGPFTLDELVQKKLLPTDLIWVEGESTSWTLPSKLEELTPTFIKADKSSADLFLNEIKPVSYSEKINQNDEVTHEPDELEKRAEELKTNILNRKQTYFNEKPAILNSVSSSENLIEKDEDFHVVFHKKPQNVAIPQILVICILIAFIVISHKQGWSFINESNKNDDEVAVPLISSSQHMAYKKSVQPVQKTVHYIKPDTTVLKPIAKIRAKPRPVAPNLVHTESNKTIAHGDNSIVEHQEDVKTYDDVAAVKEDRTDKKPDSKDKKAELKNNDDKSSTDINKAGNSSNNVNAETPKHKTISQFFKGLFKKKKKEE